MYCRKVRQELKYRKVHRESRRGRCYHTDEKKHSVVIYNGSQSARGEQPGLEGGEREASRIRHALLHSDIVKASNPDGMVTRVMMMVYGSHQGLATGFDSSRNHFSPTREEKVGSVEYKIEASRDMWRILRSCKL